MRKVPQIMSLIKWENFVDPFGDESTLIEALGKVDGPKLVPMDGVKSRGRPLMMCREIYSLLLFTKETSDLSRDIMSNSCVVNVQAN